MVDDESDPPGMTTGVGVAVKVTDEVVPEDAQKVYGAVVVEGKLYPPYVSVAFDLVAGLAKDGTCDD